MGNVHAEFSLWFLFNFTFLNDDQSDQKINGVRNIFYERIKEYKTTCMHI